jgi:integrase
MSLQIAPFSSWAHQKGVPPKVVAAIMGHAKVDMTLNVTRKCRRRARDAAIELI